VAGHDLKFLQNAFPHFEAEGIRVLIDEWQSHTAHDDARSRDLLEQADAVFCEWGLGNAVWYSKNKRAEQTLTVRVHLQELFTPHLRRITHSAVDNYVFVGELVRRAAISGHGVPPEKSTVVPNMVAVDALRLPKVVGAEKSIGLVGIVPQRKRLDVALDVLEAVRRQDPEYRLIVRGKRPEEYPWLTHRPAELEYYRQTFARIDDIVAAAPGAVVFSPHGDDMPEWYRNVGTVLSVSDFESFHLTIADGVASGALPAVLLWPGADLVYPRSWLSSSVEELAARIVRREPTVAPTAVDHMDTGRVAHLLLEIVTGAAER
jgi:glycosyltransferase involved in cell wall biosynthesis